MPAAKSVVQIIIETIDRGSAKAVSGAKKMWTAWKDLATPLNQSLELLGKVQQVAQQVGEAIQFGAEVAQTEESFKRLNDTLWNTPNLLKDMQESSKGTINDMKLMSGVLTLTAGASDELSKAYAEAAPQLVEMAKAANKLNPSLGSTEFLFSSISTGIKRASPLILDNLGIVVKAEEAYRNYAKELGKSAAELTGAEKQWAFLAEAMRGGNKLIEQVGGNVESTTDSLARLTTQVENAKAAFLGAFTTELVAGIDDVNEGFSEINENAEILGQAIGQVAADSMPLLISGAKELSGLLKEASEYMTERQMLELAVERGDLTEFQRAILMLRKHLGVSPEAQQDVDAWVEYIQSSLEAEQKAIAQSTAEGMELALELGLAEADDYMLRWAAAQKPTAKAAGEEVGAEYAEGIAESSQGLFSPGRDLENKLMIDELQKKNLEANYKSVGDSAGAMFETSMTENIIAVLDIQEESARKAREIWERHLEFLAHRGDLFEEARGMDWFGTLEDIEDFDLGQTFYNMADAAGASATALAGIAVAFGDITEAEAAALYQQALFLEGLEAIAERVVNDPAFSAQRGVEMAKELWQGIKDGTSDLPELDLSPKITLEEKSTEIVDSVNSLYDGIEQTINSYDVVEYAPEIDFQPVGYDNSTKIQDLYDNMEQQIGAFDVIDYSPKIDFNPVDYDAAAEVQDIYGQMEAEFAKFDVIDYSPKIDFGGFEPVGYESIGDKIQAELEAAFGSGIPGFDQSGMGEMDFGGGSGVQVPVVATPEMGAAQDAINVLHQEYLIPLIEDSDVTIVVKTEGADTAIGELVAVKNAVNDIPNSKTISINVTGGGDIQAPVDDAVAEASGSMGGFRPGP